VRCTYTLTSGKTSGHIAAPFLIATLRGRGYGAGLDFPEPANVTALIKLSEAMGWRDLIRALSATQARRWRGLASISCTAHHRTRSLQL
jgi:hypothetical protein